MITATQLRELRETIQDLIAVAPDTETGRAAVLRAHNLNNVHNLDEVTPSPTQNLRINRLAEILETAKQASQAGVDNYIQICTAIRIVKSYLKDDETPTAKNPMYNRFWVVKTNLTIIRDRLEPKTLARTVVTEAINALEDWFATIEGTTVTPEIAEQMKGRMWRQGQNPVQVVEINIDEAEKRVQDKLGCLKQAYNGLGCSESKPMATTPKLSNFYKEAISNNLTILMQLYQSKLGNIHVQKEYNGEPVKPNTVVVRLTWWQRNMLRFQVKRLINTLSRKKFEVKQEGKYLVIWQAQ